MSGHPDRNPGSTWNPGPIGKPAEFRRFQDVVIDSGDGPVKYLCSFHWRHVLGVPAWHQMERPVVADLPSGKAGRDWLSRVLNREERSGVRVLVHESLAPLLEPLDAAIVSGPLQG